MEASIYVKQGTEIFNGKWYKKVLKKVVIQNDQGEHLVEAGSAISLGYLRVDVDKSSGDFRVHILTPGCWPCIGLEMVSDSRLEGLYKLIKTGAPEPAIRAYRKEHGLIDQTT